MENYKWMNGSLSLTWYIFWFLIVIQCTWLQHFFSVGEERTGLPGVWEQIMIDCDTTGSWKFSYMLH